MFDFIANGLTLVVSVLLPTFLTYKALQTVPEPTSTTPSAATAATHDFLSFIQNVNAYANNQNAPNEPQANPTALLRPWLTYWITLSLVTTAEALASPITAYIPLFAWARLLLHIYLLIPGTAERLYQDTIRPFLREHEAQIEDAISQTHDKLKGRVLDSLNAILDMVRRLGLGAAAPNTGPSSSAAGIPGTADNTSYVQMLLARFTVASSAQAARPAPPSSPPPNSTADAVTATSRAVRDLYGKLKQNAPAGSASSSSSAAGASQSYTSAHGSSRAASGGPVRRNRSEMEFETISQEDAMGSSGIVDGGAGASGGGWGGWIFGGGSGTGDGHGRRRSKAKGE